MVKHFKLLRAREEIVRLNVEIRRLRTSIHDEKLHVANVLVELATTDPPLQAALQHWWNLRAAVNNRIVERLDAIERMAGYSGQQGVGVRRGRAAVTREGQAGADANDSDLVGTGDSSAGVDEDVEADLHQDHLRDIQNIGEFLEQITD
jgi:hypothetical protein